MTIFRPKYVKLAVGAAVCVVSVFAVAYAHSLLFRPVSRPIGADEGYIAAFALRMIDGHWLPYVDAVSHRGPVLYWVVAVFQRIAGAYGWTGMRVVAAAAVVVTMGLSFAAGAAVGRPIGGAFGGALYATVIICTFGIEEGMQTNGEYVAAPIGMAAVLAVAWAMQRARTQRSRYRLLAVGGMLAALQGLTKQTALPVVGPLALWALAGEPCGASVHGRGKQLAAIGAGWGGLVAIVLAVYASVGSLWDFVYYFWRYNFEIYMEPYREQSLSKEAGKLLIDNPYPGVALVLIALVGPLLLLSRARSFRLPHLSAAYAEYGMEVTTALDASLMALAAVMAFRYWPHYWVTGISFAALFVGIVFERALGAADSLGSVLAHLLGPAALIAALAIPAKARIRAIKANHVGGPPAPNPICAEVDKLTRPDDFMFVWGFNADLYVDCHRRPASRFVFTTFVAGVVPPFWSDPQPTRVALRAQETLRRELTEKTVPLILDVPGGLGGVSIASYPAYATLLADKYCPPTTVSGNGRTANLYRLRAGRACE
jgi:hypothetical protein